MTHNTLFGLNRKDGLRCSPVIKFVWRLAVESKSKELPDVLHAISWWKATLEDRKSGRICPFFWSLTPRRINPLGLQGQPWQSPCALSLQDPLLLPQLQPHFNSGDGRALDTTVPTQSSKHWKLQWLRFT